MSKRKTGQSTRAARNSREADRPVRKALEGDDWIRCPKGQRKMQPSPRCRLRCGCFLCFHGDCCVVVMRH